MGDVKSTLAVDEAVDCERWPLRSRGSWIHEYIQYRNGASHTLDETLPVTIGGAFNLELLRTGASASPFGSIDLRSLPLARMGSPWCGCSTVFFVPLAPLGRFMAGALGNGAQSFPADVLTGVEVADGRNEAGIRDPVGSKDCMIFGSGRREGARMDSAAIVGKVVSPANEGVLIRQCKNRRLARNETHSQAEGPLIPSLA